ncbi:hypothetical protein KAR91_59305 [Candidatus Pacearchaeota archaeon]|nr:hypothetical protein [Candidatus Pacearchaeota archaeon]
MFVCNDCGVEYEEESDLGIHLTSDFGEEIDDENCKCTLCGAEFEDWGDLEMHLMWGHKKGRMTGKDLEEHEEVINAPMFAELLTEIDKRR